MGIQLTSTEAIGGIPVLEIRDLLRALSDGFVRKEWFGEKGYCEHRIDHLLETLLGAGFIERYAGPAFDADHGVLYQITEKGRAMGRARAAKLIHRATARNALEAFMGRVAEVNNNPDYLMSVIEVVVFGSYLGEKERLGDIDVACRYLSKLLHLDTAARREAEHAHFVKSGRSPHGINDLFWPEEQVRLFLKSRKRTISLHEMWEVEQMISDAPEFRFEVLLGDREGILMRSRIKA